MLWSELEEEDVLWDEALDGIVVRVERVCLDVLSAGVLKRVYLGLMGPGNTIASTVQVSRGGVLIHPAETGRNVELEGSP
jgi:hypothetical protein